MNNLLNMNHMIEGLNFYKNLKDNSVHKILLCSMRNILTYIGMLYHIHH